MGTKFVSFTLVMLSGAVQTWLPLVKEKTAFISVYAKFGQIFSVFKGNFTTQKKNIFYGKLQLCSIVFKKQIHCLNKKEITRVNTNIFCLSVEHFANHSLDQMGTEGFEKLLKENHTIKTLSLAEQHLKILDFFQITFK